jgi:hypothetical protein
MRKLLLSVLVIVCAIYAYLVVAVEDDKRWFHSFSQIRKRDAAYLKFDSLQYTAYRWRLSQTNHDGELFLAYYIKITKDGSFLAMRHNTTPEPAMYLRGKIDRSVKHLLDSLEIVSLDTLYIKSEAEIYEGNSFHLNFTGSRQFDIDFYQIAAPAFLQRVSLALDTVIFESSDTSRPFDLSLYEHALEGQSLRRLGRLPRMEKPKFK